MTAQENALTKVSNLVYAVAEDFDRVLVNKDLTFAREAEFAVQHLQANSYLRDVALENAVSIQNAVVNVAALGISLNPAKKHAYLVPRQVDKKRAVCLDISYQGLIHIALESGAVEWAQAKLVYEGDEYENQGLTVPPVHKYNAFGRNRSIEAGFVGVYVVAKLPNGEYLTHEMDAESVIAIKNRSESVKAGKASPWKTDFGEMAKKAAVKQASKYWPKNGRLAQLIHHMDTTGEGIDFDAERAAGGPPSDIAIGFIESAHEIATATDSKSMETPWAGLAQRIKSAVLANQIPAAVFQQCRQIITDRVAELKAQAEADEERTIDAEPGDVTEQEGE